MIRRRDCIARLLSGAAAGSLLTSSSLYAQTKLTPDEALKTLMTGNERFATNKLTSPTQDLKALRAKTAIKQEPFAAVLACADSRVPVELLFDQSIGQIFTTRVAGNMVTPEIVASLEYALAVLGVKVILVLGHASCGALKAAMKGESVPGQISVLYQALRQAVVKSGGDEHKAIELNASIQADQLRSSSVVIHEAVQARKVRVDSGVYDIGTGVVKLNQA